MDGIFVTGMILDANVEVFELGFEDGVAFFADVEDVGDLAFGEEEEVFGVATVAEVEVLEDFGHKF